MSQQELPQAGQSQAENANAGKAMRRSSWRSALDAMIYINKISKQPELKIRQSDRVTSVALTLSIFATVLCLLLHKLNGLGLQLMLICDFFLGICLAIYACNRMGILTALPPRQAALTWQLLQAFIYIGIFITVNMTIILSLILASVSISAIRMH